MADALGMSLEQAGATLRAEINAHRAKLQLAAAVDTALTATQVVKRLEQEEQASRAALENLGKDRTAAETALGDRLQELGEVRRQLAAAQIDLAALTASIADTRKAWEAEQRTQADVQRGTLADLDRAILAEQARLAAVRKELAGVVAPYVASTVQS